MRLFIAIALDEAIRSAAAARAAAVAERLNRTRRICAPASASSIHLTLKFLGETDVPPESIERALRSTPLGSPFSMVVAGTGAFPSPARARVVWAGVTQGAESLVALARKVDEAMTGLGFPPEEHPFRPHVTLGRIRNGANATSLTGDAGELGHMVVREVTLYRSDLLPAGAAHTPLAAVELS